MHWQKKADVFCGFTLLPSEYTESDSCRLQVAESWKSNKKWWRTGKREEILRKTGKNVCRELENHILSHRKPENGRIWKTVLNSCGKPESPKKQWNATVTRKQKKSYGKLESIDISTESQKRTPYYPPQETWNNLRKLLSNRVLIKWLTWQGLSKWLIECHSKVITKTDISLFRRTMCILWISHGWLKG